jgi:hypothetical protein
MLVHQQRLLSSITGSKLPSSITLLMWEWARLVQRKNPEQSWYLELHYVTQPVDIAATAL